MGSIDTNNSEKLKLLSKEIIEFLISNPQISKDKVTNLKGRIGKKYNYSKVIKIDF